MPIISTRISTGIYHHRWIAHVTADEAIDAFEIEKQFFAEDNIDHYVVIMDGSEVQTFPLNIGKMSKLSSGQEISTLFYNAPRFGRKLGEILSTIIQLPFEFYSDWDETLDRAYQLLEEQSRINFPKTG